MRWEICHENHHSNRVFLSSFGLVAIQNILSKVIIGYPHISKLFRENAIQPKNIKWMEMPLTLHSNFGFAIYRDYRGKRYKYGENYKPLFSNFAHYY